MNFFRSLFRSPIPVPEQHQRNFRLLYLDVFWWGVLNGSTIVFLAIYAARCGASPAQLGFLTAAPAVMNLMITLPAGLWVKRFPPHKATCWAWAATRLFYLFLVPLPLLLPTTSQIWAIIAITLVMNIPGTVAAIIGSSFFAGAVPPEHRGHVVGMRNALLAASTMITSLVSGQILNALPFPNGYVIVFAIGFAGAALSNLQLFLIRPVQDQPERSTETGGIAAKDLTLAHSIRSQLRFEILSGPFGRILLLLVIYNLSVNIGAPVFPLYQVNALHFSDQTISLGTSIFWVVYFLASTRSGTLGRRIGFQKMTALGISMTSFGVILFILSFNPLLYILNNIVSGIAWAILGGGVSNYLLERVPADERTTYLSWYNLTANAALLVGSMLGSSLATGIGLLWTMILVIFIRLAAGVSILRWGNPPDSTRERVISQPVAE